MFSWNFGSDLLTWLFWFGLHVFMHWLSFVLSCTQVYYVDYGNTEVVALSDICRLRWALQCRSNWVTALACACRVCTSIFLSLLHCMNGWIAHWVVFYLVGRCEVFVAFCHLGSVALLTMRLAVVMFCARMGAFKLVPRLACDERRAQVDGCMYSHVVLLFLCFFQNGLSVTSSTGYQM